jgi:hypothetical protein
MGLTTAKYSEPSPERGESVTYTVFAVGQDGVSAASAPVNVLVPKPAAGRDDH